MDPYHRLDIAFTLDGKEKEEFQSLVGPFLFIMFTIDKILTLYILMLMMIILDLLQSKFSFPIIPSVSWNFKF